MNTLQWAFRAFLCIGLLQVVSCTKTLDTVSDDSISLPSSSDAVIVNEFSNCKLRYITHPDDNDGELVTGLFTYNAAGNPYSLTYLDRPGKGMQRNHYFYYDKLNRLREYRTGYGPDDPGEAVWHRYGYNSNNQIIVDTTLTPGFVVETLPGQTYVVPESIWTISTLTYDAQGRIIKEAIKDVSSGTTRYPTYTYDNRGNLGVNGWRSSSYDNKVGLFRSHPVFQFIHRNYSMNNAAPQPKYNSKGFPLSLKPQNDQFFNSYPTNNTWGFIGGIERIVYDCK
jgi:hypothetical protein